VLIADWLNIKAAWLHLDYSRVFASDEKRYPEDKKHLASDETAFLSNAQSDNQPVYCLLQLTSCLYTSSTFRRSPSTLILLRFLVDIAHADLRCSSHMSSGTQYRFHPPRQVCQRSMRAHHFHARSLEQKIVAFSKMPHSVTSNSFSMPKTDREYARIESKRITSGKMRPDIFPDSLCLNSITAEQNMVPFILLGVLLVLFFLCISNVAIFSMPIKSDRHEYPTLEQERSTTMATFRIRFVTLIRGSLRRLEPRLAEDHLGGRSPNRLQSP
jgi:hypothetical protein